MSFCGVSRRGLKRCEVTTIPSAFRIDTAKSIRRGRYAPDMGSLGFVKSFTSVPDGEKVPGPRRECQRLNRVFTPDSAGLTDVLQVVYLGPPTGAGTRS